MTAFREWTDANASALWLALLVTAFSITLMHSRARRAATFLPGVVAGQSPSVAAALGALVLFVVLAASHQTGVVQGFDAMVGGAVAVAPDTAMAGIARGVTSIGQPLLLAMALAIGMLALLAYRRPWAGLLLLTMVLANGAAVRAFKASFERMRPGQAEAYALAGDWSFPSGHAAGALMVFGALAWFLAMAAPRVRRAIFAVAMLLVLAIGFSRAVLEVHHVSDVVAGFAIGAAHLCALIAMTRTIETRPPR